MSNHPNFVEADVTPLVGKEKPLGEGQVRVNLDDYAKKLEKQHRVSKLLCEISEFRFRELMANKHYIEVMGQMSRADASNAEPLPEKAPKEPMPEPNY